MDGAGQGVSDQLWGWGLSLIGVAGFLLAGRKVWWAWYINIVNQIVWTAYSIITEQWGFLVGVVVYTVVFAKNAHRWTAEEMDRRAGR